jgi:zinc protease
MSNKYLLLTSMALLLATFSISACSSADHKAEAPAPETRVSMKPESKSNYRLPQFEEETLANGLRVLFVPDDKLPYLSMSMMVKSGSDQEPADQAGLASFVSELLDKGTNQRNATQIAQDLGNLGAEFGAGSGYDFSTADISGLSIHADLLLSNFFELVTQPSFSDAEIERMRKQILAGIARREDSPESFASMAFAQALYGQHPYGRPVSGTLATIQGIKKKNINQYYLRYFRPNNSILAVTGQFTPQFKAKLKTVFAAWQSRDITAIAMPELANSNGAPSLKVVLVDKPDLVQAQIRMGHFGIKRKNEDFIALRVANTILGGAFASRLNSRIRKDLGLTYNISSSFDGRIERGPFEIETFTKNTTIGQTVGETLKVLNAFKESGVTAEEVDRARGYLKGIFPTAIETPEKLAHNLLMLRLYGVPDSFLSTYWRELDRITTSDVNRAIAKYIDPANLTIMVYAPAAESQAQLKKVLPPGATMVTKSGKDL